MDALKIPMEKDDKCNEFELSLKLSIGRSYGKPEENPTGKANDFPDRNGNGDCKNPDISRFDFYCKKREECPGDPQKREKEIQQAMMRRQEARKRREERIKKSRVVVVEDKALFEAQKFKIRVKDREIRERDGLCESEGGSKEGLYLQVQQGDAHLRGSLEPSSSGASDYQTTSHKGGSSSDSGSQSSCQHDTPNHRLVSESSSQVGHVRDHHQVPQPTLSKFVEKSSVSHTRNSHLMPDKPTIASSKETSGPLVPVAISPVLVPVPHMPCVSTTGNGPNGRTITGFLYKYTNNEVSIMCDCHGSSFSPAAFVEHAGGINASNPLRHIIRNSLLSWVLLIYTTI